MKDFERLIGKTVIITIDVNSNTLLYTAIIYAYDEKFIYFLDKYKLNHVFKKDHIINISETKEEK